MKFYKYLYIGDNVKDIKKIKRKLKQHVPMPVFVIAIAPGADQLEIYHSAYLKQKYYRKHPPILVGIAATHEEAVNIVVQIAQECVDRTGNCNLKEYLKQKAANGVKA